MTPGELPLADDRIYDPLTVQVGGAHYKGRGIQPVQFLEENQFSFASACAIKYIYRYKLKGGAEDLKKAHHFLEFAELFYVTPASRHHEWRITPEEFLNSNDITGTEREVILAISGVFDEGKKAYQKARKLITELLNTL